MRYPHLVVRYQRDLISQLKKRKFGLGSLDLIRNGKPVLNGKLNYLSQFEFILEFINFQFYEITTFMQKIFEHLSGMRIIYATLISFKQCHFMTGLNNSIGTMRAYHLIFVSSPALFEQYKLLRQYRVLLYFLNLFSRLFTHCPLLLILLSLFI